MLKDWEHDYKLLTSYQREPLPERYKKPRIEAMSFSEAFKDYVGQPRFKYFLNNSVEKAKSGGTVLHHCLFYGPAGTGKTEAAKCLAKCQGGRFIYKKASEISSSKQAIKIIKSIQLGDVLLLDEIHSLKTRVAESFYSVMQDLEFENEKVPPFTLIGATTSGGKLPKPLLERFIHSFTMEPYTDEDISSLLVKKGTPLYVSQEISKRSFRNPRIAINYSIKYSENEENGILDMFKRLEVDDIGITENHMKVLMYLFEFDRPVGFETISFHTGIDVHDLSNIYEKNLIELGFIERTPKGRVLTGKGRKFVKEKESKK